MLISQESILRNKIASLCRRIVYGRSPIYYKTSYSQEGEDMVLARIFEQKISGFYVDVGAHHPQRFSNTYYFYLRGWRGINIDAMPGSMSLFNRTRPNDINLELAISNESHELTYYAFHEPALNTFSESLAKHYCTTGVAKLSFEKKIISRRLAEVLNEYLPKSQMIDFITIDVEGLDYQVLQSNDWSKFRPEMILVENLERLSVDEIFKSDIYKFTSNQGYIFYGKTMNTLFFRRLD